ncbi:hypothetical protein [Chitinophaga ginsengisoli]|uniref:Uncharacterized protein n=1 Tax=Chitinophaga ginsengisoli TaxID=363837 RepID=A0A2P8GHW1_9BACT|nr:hypothetical protein [Chitinophaga ginsengisoli]PSL33545.1 hypothetical protein CLV42_103528 [Chitinophaga ginsengisoli]
MQQCSRTSKEYSKLVPLARMTTLLEVKALPRSIVWHMANVTLLKQ